MIIVIKYFHCHHSPQWVHLLISVTYILKVGLAGCKNPQMILIFPQRDCLRTWKVSRLHCLQSLWRSFPLFMFSHFNELSIKTLKHTIFSTTMPHWHQILVIFMIYAVLSRIFLSRFTHFFRRFLETENQNPQTFILLECMTAQCCWNPCVCWSPIPAFFFEREKKNTQNP